MTDKELFGRTYAEGLVRRQMAERILYVKKEKNDEMDCELILFYRIKERYPLEALRLRQHISIYP